jgi:hypothetical protein
LEMTAPFGGSINGYSTAPPEFEQAIVPKNAWRAEHGVSELHRRDENRSWNRRRAWVNHGVALVRRKLLGDPVPQQSELGRGRDEMVSDARVREGPRRASRAPQPPGATVRGSRAIEEWDAWARHQLGFSIEN